MAPTPPNARSAPAQPRRSSISRVALGDDHEGAGGLAARALHGVDDEVAGANKERALQESLHRGPPPCYKSKRLARPRRRSHRPSPRPRSRRARHRKIFPARWRAASRGHAAAGAGGAPPPPPPGGGRGPRGGAAPPPPRGGAGRGPPRGPRGGGSPRPPPPPGGGPA